jgi:hypothetical protein
MAAMLPAIAELERSKHVDDRLRSIGLGWGGNALCRAGTCAGGIHFSQGKLQLRESCGPMRRFRRFRAAAGPDRGDQPLGSADHRSRASHSRHHFGVDGFVEWDKACSEAAGPPSWLATANEPDGDQVATEVAVQSPLTPARLSSLRDLVTPYITHQAKISRPFGAGAGYRVPHRAQSSRSRGTAVPQAGQASRAGLRRCQK